MSKATFIKQDAKIQIQVSTAFIQKVQKLLTTLISEVSDEQYEAYKKAIQDVTLTELPESWMDNIAILASLVALIEQEAEKQGFTYEQDIDEATKQVGN
jgi:archaellum biogenesis ATPase FlaH